MPDHQIVLLMLTAGRFSFTHEGIKMTYCKETMKLSETQSF
jgi:hypothetical protein